MKIKTPWILILCVVLVFASGLVAGLIFDTDLDIARIKFGLLVLSLQDEFPGQSPEVQKYKLSKLLEPVICDKGIRRLSHYLVVRKEDSNINREALLCIAYKLGELGSLESKEELIALREDLKQHGILDAYLRAILEDSISKIDKHSDSPPSRVNAQDL